MIVLVGVGKGSRGSTHELRLARRSVRRLELVLRGPVFDRCVVARCAATEA